MQHKSPEYPSFEPKKPSSLLHRITKSVAEHGLPIALSLGFTAAVYHTCGDNIKEALEREAAFDRAVLKPHIQAAQEAEYIEQREEEIAQIIAEENRRLAEAFIGPYAQQFLHRAVENAQQNADMEARAITGFVYQPVGD